MLSSTIHIDTKDEIVEEPDENTVTRSTGEAVIEVFPGPNRMTVSVRHRYLTTRLKPKVEQHETFRDAARGYLEMNWETSSAIRYANVINDNGASKKLIDELCSEALFLAMRLDSRFFESMRKAFPDWLDLLSKGWKRTGPLVIVIEGELGIPNETRVYPRSKEDPRIYAISPSQVDRESLQRSIELLEASLDIAKAQLAEIEEGEK